MNYRKPNRKGPRARLKVARVMDAKALKEFKKHYPEHSDLTLTEFNGIIKQFNKNIVDEVINHRYGVLLPERLGLLVIVSFPRSKKPRIDFGESNKTGVLTYHQNWDTDNRTAKIVYQTNAHNTSFKFNKFWSFTAARGFKQNVSAAFKRFYQRYIEIDNNGIRLKDVINNKR
jgi:hypothetical protein